MKIPLAHIRDKAKDRPSGYYDDVVSRGTIEGELIELPDEEYRKLCVKYDPRGLGDIVARIAGPIAEALGIDCGGGCAERQDKLNELVPFYRSQKPTATTNPPNSAPARNTSKITPPS